MTKHLKRIDMDRRHFVHLASGLAVGSAIGANNSIASICHAPAESLKPSGTKISEEGFRFHWWVDGILFGDRSDLETRGNLALWLEYSGPDRKVEGVVVTNSSNQVIAASMHLPTGHLHATPMPYILFDAIPLEVGVNHNAFFLVSDSNGESHVLWQEMDIQHPTRLNESFVNHSTIWGTTDFFDDFAGFLGGSDNNPTPGLTTSPLQFYTLNGIAVHSPRAWFTDIDRDTGDFSINVNVLHGDVNADHYSRYFFVMDPVGRVLGIRERNLGDPLGSVTINRLSETDKTNFNIVGNQPDIRDCPYVQVFADCKYDVLSRQVIRMR